MLTTKPGDERPCLRCIKRGLQDQCHDGVRKKAKYLHDAPNEALVPGFAGNFQHGGNGTQPLQPISGPSTTSNGGLPVSQSGGYFPQGSPAVFPQFAATTQQGHMGPPIMDSTLLGDFTNQQAPDTPNQYRSASSQQATPVQDLTTPMDQPSTLGAQSDQQYNNPFFDPNDASLFNFDVSGLNFGNHYGALEFGMLGHMSSGAVGTPESGNGNNFVKASSISYDPNAGVMPGFQAGATFGFNQNPTGFSDWQNVPNAGRQNSMAQTFSNQNGGLDAYAIGEVASTISGTSPNPNPQDFGPSYGLSPESPFIQLEQQHSDLGRQAMRQNLPQRGRIPLSGDLEMFNGTKKRRRDTSEIYASVQAPYAYTRGFHGLTAFIQRRFPSQKTLRIAKALASIRPSFISCNKNLNHEDLIFMEKCFQRTLWEYEDFVNHYGTPTIICRRTGEIAAVSKEFSLVTGWRRDVLLGKEPNLNVNTGGNNGTKSGTQTGASSRGAPTPRLPHAEMNENGRPQPVFLAELLDEDSVVQFYQDFADIAFSSSGTNIIGQPCSLLKYRTKEDAGWGPDDQLPGVAPGVDNSNKRMRLTGVSDVKADPLIRGEAGMNALGERDGRVDCSMCWTVKRDVFDIPMLIVMNVSLICVSIALTMLIFIYSFFLSSSDEFERLDTPLET